MIKSKLKKPGCIVSLILILIAIVGFIVFQAMMNSIMYFIFTWPIWLGKAFDYCLGFAEKSIFNKVIITGVLTMIGLALYKLKKNALFIFGVLEFVGGVFIFWGTLITPSSDNLTNAIALGAGLFLIVQGAENYLNGYALEEERKKQNHN